MTEKPLALIAAETADEARCDVLKELGNLKPTWKTAQENRDKAEEELLDAQTAAREKFPDTAYDEETSAALNTMSETYERRVARFRRLDSRKRSLDDKAKKLTAEVLRLVGEMREPGLWAAGAKHGPDGWKSLPLRVLCGGPDPEKEIDKQTWLSQQLEQHGYGTIDQFLKGRARTIQAGMDANELAADTVRAIDVEVWKFLERKKLTKHWPKDIEPPAGAQLDLGLDDEDGATLLDAVAGDAGQPAKAEAEPDAEEDAITEPAFDAGTHVSGNPGKAPPLISTDLMHAPKDASSQHKAAHERVITMLQGWSWVFEATLEADEYRPDKEVIERFAQVYGGSPGAMLQRIWYDLWEGKPIPTSPVSEGTTELFIECALAVADDLAREGAKAGTLPEGYDLDEVTEGFVKAICTLPPERHGAAMDAVSEFDKNLYGVLRAGLKRYKPAPAEPAKAPAKGKGGKKTTKKKAAKA